MTLPLEERRQMLTEIVGKNNDVIKLSDSFDEGTAYFKRRGYTQKQENEML